MKTSEFIDKVNMLGFYAYEAIAGNTVYIQMTEHHEMPIATVSTNIRYRYDITHRINEVSLEKGRILIDLINKYGNSPVLERTEQLADKLLTEYYFERLSPTRYRHTRSWDIIEFHPNYILIAGRKCNHDFLELLLDIGKGEINYEN